MLRWEKTAGREQLGAGGGYVEFKMPVIHTSRDAGKAVCQKDEFESNVTLV